MNTAEKLRILAVDDQADILELVTLTLTPKYEVLTLTDPSDACETVDLFEPDLVILDVMMPKVTGYQILEYMKKSPRHGHVLSVFLSAKDSHRDIKYGYKLGANLYLPKPFQPERLVKNVDSLLAAYEPRKKAYSMRDVHLRLQLKQSIHSTVNAEVAADEEEAAPHEHSTSPGRLKRVLGFEHEEQERQKWVG